MCRARVAALNPSCISGVASAAASNPAFEFSSLATVPDVVVVAVERVIRFRFKALGQGGDIDFSTSATPSTLAVEAAISVVGRMTLFSWDSCPELFSLVLHKFVMTAVVVSGVLLLLLAFVFVVIFASFSNPKTKFSIVREGVRRRRELGEASGLGLLRRRMAGSS